MTSPRRLSAYSAAAAAGLACLAAGAAGAADAPIDASKRAINTICPVSGKKIDPFLEPVKASKASRVVLIGADSSTDAEIIRAHPDQYVDAALANRKAEP
jgi:hypothetical protein